jgi:predicted nucleic acid-binding protein
VRVVIDANVIFAAIIKDSHTRRLLLNQNLSFLAPEYLLDELFKHKTEIEKKSGLSSNQVESILQGFLEIIEIVESTKFKQFMKKAIEISPDPEDSPYLALCLYENIPLWSNDARIKKQKEIPVYSTPELTKKIE